MKNTNWQCLKLILLGSFLSGCATIHSGPQQSLKVSCDTPDCTILVDQKNHRPEFGMIEIQKAPHKTLVFKSGSETQTQTLQSSLNWKGGMIPDLILTALNPLVGLSALGLDFYTGSIWETNNPAPVQFSKGELTPAEVQRLVILPPQSESLFIAEKADAILQKKLSTQFKKAQVEKSEQHFSLFEKYGLSHENIHLLEKRRNQLYHELGARHLCFSQVQLINNQYILSYTIKDLKTDQTVLSEKFSIGNYSQQEQSWVHQGKEFTRKLMPNTLGLGLSGSQTTGFSSNASVSAISPTVNLYSFNNYQLASQDNRAGTISLAFDNLTPANSGEFTLYAKMRSQGAFSSSSYDLVHTKTEWDSASMKFSDSSRKVMSGRSDSFEVGFGPEVGFQSLIGGFNLHLLGTGSVSYFSYEKNVTAHTEVYSSVKLGLEYSVLVMRSLNIKMASSFTAKPSWISNKVVSNMAGEELKSSIQYENQNTLSVSYFWPEGKRKIQRLARQP